MQTIETTPQVVFVLGCHMCHVVPFRARGPMLHHAQLAEMMLAQLAMQRRSRVTSYQYIYIYIFIHNIYNIYLYTIYIIYIWVVHPDESSGFIIPGLKLLFNPIRHPG